jgi:hypothetical protein
MKWVIFDLDGTLADITKRREISTLPSGKMDWDRFFDPENIKLDEPNIPVIEACKAMKAQGYGIAIFSGRSKATKLATQDWLSKWDVPCDILKMRPTGRDWHYMPDDKLKKHWLDDIIGLGADILCVFDDRDKVVQMWRQNGIPCFQVAPGDF